MARIRTIKPSYWTSEQVMNCSPNARLLFIGLWNFCDDRGVHPLSVKTIKASVFPSDDFSGADIQRMIAELTANDLLGEFEDENGNKYINVTGWSHQKIDRPSYRYPAPPKDNQARRRQLSLDVRRTLGGRHPPEGKGREGKGREEEGNSTTASSNSSAAGQTEPIKPLTPLQVVDAFDASRIRAYGENHARLHGHGTDQLVAARWIEQGLTLDLATQVFDAVHAKVKGRSGPIPRIHTLVAMESDILSAIEISKRPAVAGAHGGSQVRKSAPDPETARRQLPAAVRNWMHDGRWPDSPLAGPAPGLPGCLVPLAELVEIVGADGLTLRGINPETGLKRQALGGKGARA